MNNTEKSWRTVLIALIIAAAAIAAVLIPTPPALAPTIELKPAPAFVEKAEAAEIAPEPLPAKPVLRQALVSICSCESMGVRDAKPQHYEKDGITVLRGRVNPKDIGMCQIHAPVWEAEAVELGFDIYTPEGNIRMANWIYDHYGAKPWSPSKGCHGQN